MNTHSIGAFLPLLCVVPVLGPFYYVILCVLCVGTYAGKNGLKEHCTRVKKGNCCSVHTHTALPEYEVSSF